MLEVTTTEIFDATKYLACSSCPLHNNCNKYMLICDFMTKKLFFGANLLCVLERAENAVQAAKRELVKNNFTNPSERVKTLYKDFLPQLNNNLEAFYKYDCDNASDYHKQTLIFALAESLEFYDLLREFDFVYSRDVENTRDVLAASFEHELNKTVPQIKGNGPAGQNNTTK